MVSWFSWNGSVSLSDGVALAGFIIALIGLGMNTFQVQMLVRQLRLDAMLRVAESSRRFATVGIERPELWESVRSKDSKGGPEEILRSRFIQLWLNHVVIVWKCWRSGMLDASDWDACCRDIESLLSLPAVREEWFRVRVFYPRSFQEEVGRLCFGVGEAVGGR
jgi:hypothetical protein